MSISNVRIYGLEESIKASGYPMQVAVEGNLDKELSVSDEIRASHLGNAKAGSGHNCFAKGIVVQFDWSTPVYMQPQILRYHFIDIISSQSAMHRITKMNLDDVFNRYTEERIIDIIKDYVKQYNEETDPKGKAEIFKMIMANLPQGLMKTARFTTNYLQLQTMYNQRRHHKLQEWHEFCDWCETLPMFKQLCLNKNITK